MKTTLYSSYIKSINLELQSYPDYANIEELSSNKYFIGRQKQIETLELLLNNNKNSGSFLITGYRGMGKTTYVNKCLENHKQKNKNNQNIIVAKINLGQSNIKEFDIYRQILFYLQANLLNRCEDILNKNIFSFKLLPIFTIAAWSLILFFSAKFSDLNLKDYFATPINSIILAGLLSIAISILFISALLMVRAIHPKYRHFILQKGINRLYNRCISQIEENHDEGLFMDKFKINLNSSKKINYVIATPKEIENEIINYLDKISKLQDKKFEFIFVFDEIDKLNNKQSPTSYHEEMTDVKLAINTTLNNNFRQQRARVLEFLGSLKYLATTAKAKFIFVAGREMFDASLADVSDRQSSLSSIFQHVIYIDSFIKDNTYSSENSKSKGFTELIEVYLSNLLLSEHVYTLNDTFLSKYYKQLVHNNGGATSIAIFKVVTCLQNLIIYLTYRSNGSPKKLKKLIDENVILIPFENYSQKDHKNIFIYAKKNNSLGSSKYFLNINYYNQYKYNFTSYLYRPFIISNSRYIKRYSDKMLVSITYLMDHIIKFHPFAFSLNNLETVPELISETKNPELREFIENLINYLSINHIRETEIGLFDYKYYNKTSIELTYISKIFEDESAAFNFSLDESYDIKLFIKMRIKELRSIFKNYNSVSSTDSIQFNSIVFLNALLADISFFDQEYDEAIISYSDAILTLGEKPTANDDYGKIYNYCKLKLKLGLTYEKMKSYDLALSHYYDVLNYSRKYLSVINIENESNSLSRKAISTIFTQSCIASLYLVEKKNPEGVSAYDLEELQSALDSLKFSDYLHKIEIHFLFYNSIGHLLFYKNARFDNFKISGNNLSFDFESDKLFCWFKRNSRPDILDQRQCLESLKCYLTAACILYQKTSIIKDNKTVESLTILSHIYSIIRANSANQSKSLLVNFAQLCSNIADTLLTNLYNDYNAECLDSIEISCSQYYLNTEYLDQWHIAEVNKLIHQKITVSSGEVFQIIISLLYTSGKTFLWAGRSVSYGFQLKKILNIFRRIAEVKFLIYYEKIIRNCIFPECINVVSWNSSSTDRQQLEKYKHHFNLLDQYYQPHLTSRYLFSATSANPEIREVVLFYTFINHKLKVSELKLANQKFKQDDLYNRMNYHTLLSQYNLVSSQYIRIHELHLQYAINFTLINNSNNKILRFISEKWNPKNGYFDSYKINDANIPFPIDNINSNLIRVLELIKIQIKKQNYEIKDIESLIMEFKSNNLWKIDEKILKYMLKNSKFLTENKSIFNYIIKMSKIFGYKKEEFEEAMNIVNNSIYCLTEIIKIYNSSGINYLINYSSLGDYHRRLGEILKQFEYFKLVYKSRYFMVENEKGIKNMLRNSIHNTKDLKLSKCKTHDPFLKLIKVINKDFVITLKPISQFHLAIKNYYEALHLHQERYPYKIKLSNMYCLEDDFSDNLYHFGIALERQKINSGYLRHQIDKLKKDEINDTPLMNYDFHI